LIREYQSLRFVFEAHICQFPFYQIYFLVVSYEISWCIAVLSTCLHAILVIVLCLQRYWVSAASDKKAVLAAVLILIFKWMCFEGGDKIHFIQPWDSQSTWLSAQCYRDKWTYSYVMKLLCVLCNEIIIINFICTFRILSNTFS
jgi:hypothetical protein